MDLPPPVREALQPFNLSRETLETIRDKMAADFRLGLQKGTPAASAAMLPSFVPELPTGSETGRYVSMDLSGKNLRILFLHLKGTTEEPLTLSTNYLVPKEVMLGTGVQLFDFMVGRLEKFLAENGLNEEQLSLGFVFSYPCEMNGIRSARLLWWTKGFNVADCLNKDVGQMLQEALDRKQVKVKVKAIMNDTVAQLAAASHSLGPQCTMGVVVGYGCNSAYLEESGKIEKCNLTAAGYEFPNMIVDTEWEEFGRHGELDAIMTTYDREIDQQSVHKGGQLIDKLTGALYLGELVRIIIDQFCVDGLMFGGMRPEQLATPDAFPTKYISEILCDDDADSPFLNVRRIMDELHIPIHGATDYLIVRAVCHSVTERSASIVAAAMSALTKVSGRQKLIIGVGGALIQYHPNYLEMLQFRLDELMPPEVCSWEVVPDERGSAYGAAIIAGVADRLQL